CYHPPIHSQPPNHWWFWTWFKGFRVLGSERRRQRIRARKDREVLGRSML
ncbi:hypothetical protein LINPERHAP1_LOCUS27144, partial [Linum perenne]